MELEQIGYDEHFRTQFAALGAGLIAARIAIAHGESYVAWTERGTRKAILVGHLLAERVAASRPQVGDWVAGTYSESADALLIEHLLERRTCLVRRATGKREAAQVIASNVDVVAIVSAFGQSEGPARARRLVDEGRLQRYLAAVAQCRAEPLLIVNKADLIQDPTPTAAELERLFPGVPVVLTSAAQRLGLDALARWLRPRSTFALIGMSGVGKSTLVNALLNRSAQRTSEVRKGDARGRHTTTHRELFVMDSGALLLDMPGTREFGVWEAEGVAGFDEVLALAAQCRFQDCRHQAEPGCAVQVALRAGQLLTERLAAYRARTEKSDGARGSGLSKHRRRRE